MADTVLDSPSASRIAQDRPARSLHSASVRSGRFVSTAADGGSSGNGLNRPAPSPRYHSSLTPRATTPTRATTPRASSPRVTTPRATTPRATTPRASSGLVTTPRASSGLVTTPRGSSVQRSSTPRASGLRSPLPLTGGSHHRFGHRRVVVTSDDDDLDAVSVLTESTTHSSGAHDAEERLNRYRSASTPRNVPMSPHYEHKAKDYTPRFSRLSIDTGGDGQDAAPAQDKIFCDSPRSTARSVRSSHCERNEQEEQKKQDSQSRYTRGLLDGVPHTPGSTRRHQHQRFEGRDDGETSASNEDDNRSLFTEQVVARKARTDLERALNTVEAASPSRASLNGRTMSVHREKDDTVSLQSSGSARRYLSKYGGAADDSSSVSRGLRRHASEDTSVGSHGRESSRRVAVPQSPSASTLVHEFEPKAEREGSNTNRESEHPRLSRASMDHTRRGERIKDLHINTSRDDRDCKSSSQPLRWKESNRNDAVASTPKSAREVPREEEIQELLKKTRAEVKALESRLEQSQKEKQGKEDELEALLKSNKSETSMLERSLSIKDRTIASLKSEVREANIVTEEKLLESREEVERLKREGKQYQCQISQQEKDLNMVTQTFDSVKNESDDLREEVTHLRKQVKLFESENSLIGELEKQLEDAQSSLERMRRDKEGIEDDTNRRLVELQEQLSEKVNELSTTKADLHSDLEILQADNMDLRTKLEEEITTNEGLRAELENALAACHEEEASLRRRASELAKEVELSEQKAQDCSIATENVKAELAASKKMNEELEREVDEKRRDLEASNRRLEECEEKLRESHVTAMTLKTAVAAKEQRLSSSRSDNLESRLGGSKVTGASDRLRRNADESGAVETLPDERIKISSKSDRSYRDGSPYRPRGDRLTVSREGGRVSYESSYGRGGTLGSSSRSNVRSLSRERPGYGIDTIQQRDRDEGRPKDQQEDVARSVIATNRSHARSLSRERAGYGKDNILQRDRNEGRPKGQQEDVARSVTSDDLEMLR